MSEVIDDLEALRGRIAELEAEAARRLVTQRDLNRAKDQLDIEFARFEVIQKYVGRVLAVEGDQDFFSLTLETVIEAFEYEIALFLVCGDDENYLDVAFEFGVEEAPEQLTMDADWFTAGDAHIHDVISPILQAWSGLNLEQAISCSIIGDSGRLDGVIVAGITKESADLFDPIVERDRSSYSVLVQQAADLWTNRKLTKDIHEKNLSLESKTANQVIMQRDLVKAKDLVDSELARFKVLQGFIGQALDAADDETFYTLALEGLIEAFEYEVALFLRVGDAPAAFDVVSQFGFAQAPETLPVPPGMPAAADAIVVDAEGDVLSAWSELGLNQAIICPFFDRTNELAGVFLGGITVDSADYYDAISEDQISAFSVMVRQAGSLWTNRQLNEEIRQHNVHLQELTASYSRFVPFQFLELLSRQSIQEIHTGDSVLVETSVLFADIRGFTTLSEQLGAQGIFTTLNEFLKVVEPFIAAHGGFINQYLGDAIMALFPGASDGALRCARDMMESAVPFNQARSAAGQPPIRFGLGISTGPLMVGAIGGGKRLDSNVIGDTANLASRTEGLTKVYGTPCLFTGSTRRQLEHPGEFSFREVDRVIVKGRESSVALFELLLDGDGRRSTMEAFSEGLAYYRVGAFDAAHKAFSACRADVEDDVTAALYMERCETFSENPPAESWDGVWILEHK